MLIPKKSNFLDFSAKNRNIKDNIIKLFLSRAGGGTSPMTPGNRQTLVTRSCVGDGMHGANSCGSEPSF
jgi:hypothetical protein